MCCVSFVFVIHLRLDLMSSESFAACLSFVFAYTTLRSAVMMQGWHIHIFLLSNVPSAYRWIFVCSVCCWTVSDSIRQCRPKKKDQAQQKAAPKAAPKASRIDLFKNML